MAAIAPSATTHLAARGRRLEYFTIGWNCLEAVIAIISGIWAGSIALVGFGLDSLIEVTSGAALLWRLHHEDSARKDRIEGWSLRIVGWCFLALAAYILADSVWAFRERQAPEESWTGIVLAAVSLLVMPWLAREKQRVAAGIRSNALRADARQTELCAWLSAILLGGLLLHALFGWWWADPAAGLVMTPIIAKEGIDALRGKACGCAGGACHSG
jgi:divalent metal cation (Fe/Co/Zn/Cd) transporter